MFGVCRLRGALLADASTRELARVRCDAPASPSASKTRTPIQFATVRYGFLISIARLPAAVAEEEEEEERRERPLFDLSRPERTLLGHIGPVTCLSLTDTCLFSGK